MYGKHITITEMFNFLAEIIRDTDDCGMPEEYTPEHRRRLAEHFANSLQGLDSRFDRADFMRRAAGN